MATGLRVETGALLGARACRSGGAEAAPAGRESRIPARNWAASAAPLLLLIVLLWSVGAAAHPPYGLAADRAGNVYFSDLETVWRVGPDDGLSVFVPAVAGTHVHEVALTADGALEGDRNRYDPATQRFYTGLWRRTADGKGGEIVALTETPPEGLGVWQDKRGNRYTTSWPSAQDRRTMLTRRSPDGRAQLLFAEGKRPPSIQKGVASIGGMAPTADGALFFADRNLLRRLDPNDQVTLVHAGPQESSLRGLWITADGAILAADMGRRLVLKIDAKGAAEPLYRSAGGWSPTAVAERGGRLLVLEANTNPRDYENRVRLVEVVGDATRVLAAPGSPDATPSAKASPPGRPADAPAADAPNMVAMIVAGGVLAGLAIFLPRRRS